MRIFNVFLCIAGLLGVTGSGCNLINPKEVLPTYVHIDTFAFSKDPGRNLGSASKNITNVYVYFNNAPVGIFDLPATFPVMATGPGTLTVLPGIDFTGLRGYQVIYPLYTGHDMQLTPAPGETVNYTPVTSYGAGVKLRILEEFEEPGNAFVKISGDTNLANTTVATGVFEGSGSGVFHLGPGKDSATVSTLLGHYIPPNVAAYIELDYKGNMPLQVGMSALRSDGSNMGQTFITLRPRNDWGKIYIGIREFVSANQGPEYRILFRVQKPSDVTEGRLYLDNIKAISL